MHAVLKYKFLTEHFVYLAKTESDKFIYSQDRHFFMHKVTGKKMQFKMAKIASVKHDFTTIESFNPELHSVGSVASMLPGTACFVKLILYFA